MSRRVFYIVHLDKGRILALSVVGAGLILTAFAAGFRFANGRSQPVAENAAAEIGRDATRSLLASRPTPAAAQDSTSPEDRPSPLAATAAEPPASRDDETRLAKRESHEEPETRREDRPSAADERLALAKKKVNLLDSAMPEDAPKKDLDVYRRRNSNQADTDESASTNVRKNERRAQPDEKERKPRKHRVKHDRKQQSREKAEKRDRTRKDQTEKAPRKKRVKKKVEKDSDQDQASSAREESAQRPRSLNPGMRG